MPVEKSARPETTTRTEATEATKTTRTIGIMYNNSENDVNYSVSGSGSVHAVDSGDCHDSSAPVSGGTSSDVPRVPTGNPVEVVDTRPATNLPAPPVGPAPQVSRPRVSSSVNDETIDSLEGDTQEPSHPETTKRFKFTRYPDNYVWGAAVALGAVAVGGLCVYLKRK